MSSALTCPRPTWGKTLTGVVPVQFALRCGFCFLVVTDCSKEVSPAQPLACCPAEGPGECAGVCSLGLCGTNLQPLGGAAREAHLWWLGDLCEGRAWTPVPIRACDWVCLREEENRSEAARVLGKCSVPCLLEPFSSWGRRH